MSRSFQGVKRPFSKEYHFEGGKRVPVLGRGEPSLYFGKALKGDSECVGRLPRALPCEAGQIVPSSRGICISVNPLGTTRGGFVCLCDEQEGREVLFLKSTWPSSGGRCFGRSLEVQRLLHFFPVQPTGKNWQKLTPEMTNLIPVAPFN